MCDRPSGNDEPSATAVPGREPSVEPDLPKSVRPPPFVCVLPCSAPPVKYLDRLDGCARGLHVTREDTKHLQLSLYGTMADVIMAKEDPVGAIAPNPCAVCKAPIVMMPSLPLFYMENCVHYFHYGCFRDWSFRHSNRCPNCQVKSSRVLLWSELFPSEAAKNDTFQLQKHSLGLDVAPQTEFEVNRGCGSNCSIFRLNVNSKTLTLRKRPFSTIFKDENEWIKWIKDRCACDLRLMDPPGREPTCGHCGERIVKRERREAALRQFWCPFDRRQDGPNGGRCTKGKKCEFWHESQSATVLSRGGERPVERPAVIRDFPRFFCVRHARDRYRSPWHSSSERIQVHSQQMARCLAGFHPTLEDLENVDAFACKMAKQIMGTPVVVPEQPLDCAFCHQPQAEPNSVVMHLQNCVHWLHLSCLAQARLAHSTNPNQAKLDLPCPTCQVSSVRSLAWPGPFQSDMAKQTIFGRQLEEFKLQVNSNIALLIVQVPNKVNLFTVSCGSGPLVTFNADTVPNDTEFQYN